MKDTSLRIDTNTSDILEVYSKELNLSKKELVLRMTQYCYHNNVRFNNKNNAYTLHKDFKIMENKIINKLDNLPIIIKKILDPDDDFSPLFYDFELIIQKYKSFIEENNLSNKFLESLNSKEIEDFKSSESKIEQNNF